MAIQEEVIFEGGPHAGDLVVNSFVGATVVGLPLFIGSLVRRLWVRYRITNRRITVTGGWLGRERSDIIYAEIAKVVTVPRGLGTWGDMVLTLKDGTRLEMRAVPRFRELFDYINQRLDQSAQRASGHAGDKNKPPVAKGSRVA
ncbi:MAG: PH domain-containing protein [Thermostichales cyanobacterium DRC_bins_46]